VSIWNLFLVGIGGGFGSALRYLLSLAFAHSFPFATLIVNAAGSALLGFLAMGFSLSSFENAQPMKLLLCVGFCGGFTTFSTFSFETIQLLQNGKAQLALTNIICNLGICLLFTFLGCLLVRAWFPE
jgi:CrcB protein